MIFAIILLSLTNNINAFQKPQYILSERSPLRSDLDRLKPTSFRRFPNVPVTIRSNETKLMLDVFGLGPPEVLIIMIAAFFLYGGDGLKEKVTGVKGAGKNDGIRGERAERIKNQIKYASKVRKTRSWKRVNALIEAEDPTTLRRLDELNVGEEL